MRRIITEWTPEHLPSLDDVIAIYSADRMKFSDYLRGSDDYQATYLGAGTLDTTENGLHYRADYTAVVISWTDHTGFQMGKTLIQAKNYDDEPTPWGRMFNVIRAVTAEELPWMAQFCITEAHIREDSYQGLTFGFDTQRTAA